MEIIFHDEVGSTNDEALKLAKKGAGHLTCVWANRQTVGRGRQGRVWHTFAGKSIATSFIICGVKAVQLPLVLSIAVQKTLAEASGIKCQIKWPNDILINNKKVAGILVESCGTAKFCIAGIGININTPQIGFPEGFTGTTLQVETGKEFSREDILKKLIQNIHHELDVLQNVGWQELAETYKSLCITLGKEVRWERGGEVLVGMAANLLPSGALLLLLDSGKMVEISSGDIIEQ